MSDGNDKEKEIRELLNSAVQNTTLKTHKSHTRLTILLCVIVAAAFMSQTIYALRDLSEEIKETTQLATQLQNHLACTCNGERALASRYD